MRFSEAIKQFNKYRALEKESLTLKGNDLDLRQFCLWMRNPYIMQITNDHIIEYLNGMKELGWSQNTIMVKGTCLSQFFKYWKKKGYPVLDHELIPRVKREYVEARVASENNTEKLIEYCDKHPDDIYCQRNKALILMYADTGCRNSEILGINRDIDTELYEVVDGVKQFSHIIKTKKTRGAKPFRKIFWYERANEALKKWKHSRNEITYDKDKEALFIGVKTIGNSNCGARLSPGSVGTMLRKLCVDAGIPSLNAHSLRHKLGNDMAAHGANNSTISDVMGHASLASSFVYTHLNNDQMSKAHVKYRGSNTPENKL